MKKKIILISSLSLVTAAVPIVAIASSMRTEKFSTSLKDIANFVRPQTIEGWEMIFLDAKYNMEHYFGEVQSYATQIALSNKDLPLSKLDKLIYNKIFAMDDFQLYIAYNLRMLISSNWLYEKTNNSIEYGLQEQDIEILVSFKYLNATTNDSAFVIWDVINDRTISLQNIYLNKDLRKLTVDTYESVYKNYQPDIDSKKSEIINMIRDKKFYNYQSDINSLSSAIFDLNEKIKEFEEPESRDSEEEVPPTLEELEEELKTNVSELDKVIEDLNFYRKSLIGSVTARQYDIDYLITTIEIQDYDNVIKNVLNSIEFELLIISKIQLIDFNKNVNIAYKNLEKIEEIKKYKIPEESLIGSEEEEFMTQISKDINSEKFNFKTKDGIGLDLAGVRINGNIKNISAYSEYVSLKENNDID